MSARERAHPWWGMTAYERELAEYNAVQDQIEREERLRQLQGIIYFKVSDE